MEANLDLLRTNPELRPFVLSNVRATGVEIGVGSYGSVKEVAIPGAICAAKRIHDFLQDKTQRQRPLSAIELDTESTRFVKECKLMSALRHPNIVQFFGIYFFPDSRLPALIMERMMTSLHDLLDPQTNPTPPLHITPPKPFFPLYLKRSILNDVASGLAFLHEQSPPVIHRDLSARNILLNPGMVAKIADLGMARIVRHIKTAAIMTKAPGANIYMPPEALENKPGDEKEAVKDRDKQSKYDASIDIFSFGVVTIFILSQTFPCDLLAPNYREGGRHIARTELERREEYMKMIRSQLPKGHPLLKLIESCLGFSEDRPGIHDVIHMLRQADAEKYHDDEKNIPKMNRLELIQALQLCTNDQKAMVECVTLERDKAMEEVLKKDAELEKANTLVQRYQVKNEELITLREDVKQVKAQCALFEQENQKLQQAVENERKEKHVALQTEREKNAFKNKEIEYLKEEVKAKTAQVGQYKKQKQIAPELEEEFQIKLATCQSKLEGTESLFKELSSKYQEIEEKVNAKDSEIQKMQAKCHAMVAELKKHEAKQQMAQRESEIQLAQVEEQKTVIASELSQLQKERNREDEFSKAFQQEFEANKFLRAKCAEFENQLGIAYDSLDELRQKQQVLMKTLTERGIELPFIEVEPTTQCDAVQKYPHKRLQGQVQDAISYKPIASPGVFNQHIDKVGYMPPHSNAESRYQGQLAQRHVNEWQQQPQLQHQPQQPNMQKHLPQQPHAILHPHDRGTPNLSPRSPASQQPHSRAMYEEEPVRGIPIAMPSQQSITPQGPQLPLKSRHSESEIDHLPSAVSPSPMPQEGPDLNEDDDEIPDANLECVICQKVFKIGQIQLYKRHVRSCIGSK